MRTICLVLAAAALSAQTIQVSGRVLTVSGQPIPEARITWRQIGVSVTDPRAPQPFTTTNAEGAFTLTPPAPGQYALTITKTGWITQNRTITLTSGQTLTDLSFRIVPASSITGRVLDSDGNPVAKAMVTAYRYAYIRGARSLNTSNYSVATDANGAYTLPNLTAGRYYLRVEANGPAVATYYPSTLDSAAASAIDVDTGAVRSGVEIRQRKEALFHIRGKAVDESGAPAANAALTILTEQPIESLTPPTRVPSAADGSFEFKDLLPGRYVIRATPNGNVVTADRQIFPAKGAGRISVNITRENIEDLKFTLDEGYTLVGRIKTDDGSTLPVPSAPAKPLPPGAIEMSGLRVSLSDAEQTFTAGNLNVAAAPEGGAFRIEKIPPAKYYVRVSPLPPNVYIKSVRYGGQDITRSPIDLMYGGGDNLEIILGTKAGTVSVTVRNSKGEVVPRVQVALWPDSPDKGTSNSSIRVVTSDDNGVVRFTSLRPEKYHLAAFAEAEQAFVQSPDFLDRFRSRAVELEVGDGASLERILEPISREDAVAVIRNLP